MNLKTNSIHLVNTAKHSAASARTHLRACDGKVDVSQLTRAEGKQTPEESILGVTETEADVRTPT